MTLVLFQAISKDEYVKEIIKRIDTYREVKCQRMSDHEIVEFERLVSFISAHAFELVNIRESCYFAYRALEYIGALT